ncbi:hypothetical protein G3R49_13870 [Shewanella sp. WXL01]|uniref:OmpP1/FadL family transporter n=1 Tax=Shewanella sp. WXL01 TaxID=2709721 RepID=UPI0014385C9B|nr:outer membrane protein transport protein [Shewanella sp. WXL01]NKF51648.1 hypothetical protein [Shewanella sp. WXL01]
MRYLLLLIAFVTHQTNATGLNFWESSTLNSALASANGANAGDASVLALAPSSITAIEAPTLTASVTYYEVTTDYNIFGNQSQYSVANPIPMGFFVTPINESWFFGLSVYSRTAADITVPSIPLVHPRETRVQPILVSASPSIAYKMGTLSIAGTLEYIHAPYTLEQTSCSFGNCNTTTSQDTAQGWGAGISATWDIHAHFSMAFMHRFESQLGNEDIDIRLPAITSLYASLKLGQHAQWHNSYSLSQWDGKGITYNDYIDPIGLLTGFQDSHRLATSIEYELADWTLHAGFSADQAVDQFGGIDKRYRVGVGHKVNDQITLNLAAVFESYSKKQANVEGTTLVEVQNSGAAYSLGVTYNF